MKSLALKALSITLVFVLLNTTALANKEVGKSPWGPDDETGRLNLMSDKSRLEILSRIGAGKSYDLSVEYHVGMPSWSKIGDPRFQYWLTHTPRGATVDDPMKVGEKVNNHVSYTGDAVSMYTHMGTHIDALNHFGLNGKIWNGFAADRYLGDRGWAKTGAETIPPIIARGILIDVASAKGLDELPPNYRIMAADLRKALAHHKVELKSGDVVMIRTGRMARYYNDHAFMHEAPGLDMDAARWLVEEKGVMMIGADNLSLEAFPSQTENNYIPVHTYLLAEQGVMIMELVMLEELAKDKVYEFAFIGGSLKFRGASAAPMRPIAFSLKQ